MEKGFSFEYAEAKVSQDILLSYIAKSKYKNNVTIKGGIVMFNITNNRRRATEDIDIDLIKYSLDNKFLVRLFDKLSNNSDNIKIQIFKKPELLNHENYKGKRIILKLEDSYNNIIYIKVDIGVQSDIDIKQEKYLFHFEFFNSRLVLLVNTKEQIFVEKLYSLLIHGSKTTRYKDIYDLYYFISECKMNFKILKVIILKIIFLKNNRFKSNLDIYKRLEEIFNNDFFLNNLNNSKYKWLDVDITIILEEIKKFLLLIDKY